MAAQRRGLAGPGRPSSRRRPRFAVVAVLAIAIVGAGFLAIRFLAGPGPRATEDWTLLDEMQDARGETAAAVADGRLHVVGGMTGLDLAASPRVSVYDPSRESWRAGPSLPEPRHHAAAAAFNGSVYVSGGADPAGTRSATLWALPRGASAWQALAPLPEGRYGHRMVVVDGRLYVVGGAAGARTNAGSEPPGLVDGSVLIHDLATGAWSAGAPMPLVRDHLSVVVVGGEIWAIGGRAGGVNHARVDIYDPVADSWRAGPTVPEATSGAAEAVVNGWIYISGGEDPAARLIVDRHWRLDPTGMTELVTSRWEPLPSPPLAVHGASGASLDRHFVIVAGSTRPGSQSNTAWTGALQQLLAAP